MILGWLFSRCLLGQETPRTLMRFAAFLFVSTETVLLLELRLFAPAVQIASRGLSITLPEDHRNDLMDDLAVSLDEVYQEIMSFASRWSHAVRDGLNVGVTVVVFHLQSPVG